MYLHTIESLSFSWLVSEIGSKNRTTQVATPVHVATSYSLSMQPSAGVRTTPTLFMATPAKLNVSVIELDRLSCYRLCYGMNIQNSKDYDPSTRTMDTKTLLKDAATLQKPRILCLHGGGSNARIFRKQCRILERWLQSSFRLCYAEAPFSSRAGSDVLSVYETYGPFKAWLRWNQDDQFIDSESVIKRIRNALVSTMTEDDLKGATGEWVGLLGFSQGAKICASILLAQQQGSALFQGYRPQPVFKFGVLLAGSAPLVSLMPERPLIMGLADASALSMGPLSWRSSFPFPSVLTIPTIHVHGLRDPGLERHRRLLQDYCDLDRVSLFEWDGDHRVPVKTKDVSVLVEKILTMAGSLRVLDSVDVSFPGSEKLVSSSVVMSYWSVK